MTVERENQLHGSGKIPKTKTDCVPSAFLVKSSMTNSELLHCRNRESKLPNQRPKSAPNVEKETGSRTSIKAVVAKTVT